MRTSLGRSAIDIQDTMNLIAYADGRSLLEIANMIDKPMWDLKNIVEELKERGIL